VLIFLGSLLLYHRAWPAVRQWQGLPLSHQPSGRMASYLAPTLQRSAGSTARGLRCAPVELQQHGVGSMTARRTRRKASLFLIDQKGSTRAHSSPQASSALTDNDGISTIDALSMGPPIVVPVRPRPSVSAPEPPPLLHSPTFLQQTLSSRSMSSLDEDAQVGKPTETMLF
jgi:hypothetical protein